MQLTDSEIPVAVSMHRFAGQWAADERALVPTFVCYWAAFHNIYTALGARAGLHPRFELRRNGTIQTEREGGVKVVRTRVPSEGSQIDATYRCFSADLKHRLIAHPSTRFFAYRTPTYADEVHPSLEIIEDNRIRVGGSIRIGVRTDG